MIKSILEEYPKFYLTQTATKDFEKDETCPTRWKGLWLDKTITFPSNEDMDKGKYFEWLALGGGAKGSDQEVTDLPRVYGGKKSVDQIRIEEQAERFKRLFKPDDPDYQGLEITDTQIKLSDLDKRHEGTLDFQTKEIVSGNVWINDLKLTRDVTSTRSKYGWGNSWSDLDMLQMILYADLFEKKHGIKPRVALWVFDYSPAKKIKIGEIKISRGAKSIKDLRMDAVIDVMELYHQDGWTTVPSESECRLCPLTCAARYSPGPIEKFVINI